MIVVNRHRVTKCSTDQNSLFYLNIGKGYDGQGKDVPKNNESYKVCNHIRFAHVGTAHRPFWSFWVVLHDRVQGYTRDQKGRQPHGKDSKRSSCFRPVPNLISVGTNDISIPFDCNSCYRPDRGSVEYFLRRNHVQAKCFPQEPHKWLNVFTYRHRINDSQYAQIRYGQT